MGDSWRQDKDGNWYSVKVQVKGNPDLKPQLTTSLEFGFDLSQNYWNFSGTYFYSKTKDRVQQYQPDPNVEFFTYRNLPDPSVFSGLEFNGAIDIAAYFDAGFTLEPFFSFTTYFDKYITDPVTKNHDPAGNTPKWLANYGVRFNSTSVGLSANINAMSNSGWTDSYTLEKVPSTTVVDITIDKILWENPDYSSKVKVKTSVRNVFNKYWEATYAYPSPGRTFYIGLSYDYN
jgi:vitamin B12 transporter